MKNPKVKFLSWAALLLMTFLSGLLMQCRPRATSESKNALSSLAPSFRLFHQGRNKYRIRFPGTKTEAADGQSVTIEASVVQKLEDEPVKCAPLQDNQRIVGTLKRSEEYLQVDFEYDDKVFDKCTDSDKSRKLSLKCQKSGDWNGAKTLEVCLYDANNKLVVSGRAAPEGRMLEQGASLSLAQSIPHTDDVLSYGKVCAERLGSLPRDWSCKDGTIIPITRDGVEVPFGQHQPLDTCDNQIYLGLGNQGQCVPYARLGRLQTKPDVETVFICRRYKIGDTVLEWTDANEDQAKKVTDHVPADVPLHQDVAIVQHNVKTGETCYFQGLSVAQAGGKDLPTARIPPPDEEEIPADIKQKYANLPLKQRPMKASKFWITPGQAGTEAYAQVGQTETYGDGFQCVKCHDSDPFMHSPYVDQLNYIFPKGHPFAGRKDKMVPCAPGSPESISKPECVFLKNGVKYASGKYSQLHKTRAEMWPNSFHIAPKNDDTCVRCHKIGSINTCGRWVKDSIGQTGVYPEYVSNYGKLFPESHWMPITNDFYADQKTCKPNPSDPANPIGCTMNLATWKQTFGQGAARTVKCCNLAASNPRGDPAKDSAEFKQLCVREPITTPPPAASAANQALVHITQEVPIKDYSSGPGVTDVSFSPAVSANGKVAYINLKAEIYHDSHGDLRIELVHAGKRAIVFDGQESGAPNAYGPLYISANSVDNEAMQALMSDSPEGEWSLEIIDEGALEQGSLKNATLDVSYN
jgi:subtilisin-like proprotein convertase family protein